LVAQDKNKYNSPKYRFVVRLSNRDIVCQIAYAKLAGDVILGAAYSHELPRYGMPTGLTNYAAAYATGLLLARRVLAKLNLADKYQGKADINGEDFNVVPLDDGPNPFCALLDVGLRRTTTGARVFGAMKGACDGGLNIPHTERRFVGYDAEAKKLDPAILRKYIFGGHVSDYMKSLKEENPPKYEKLFSSYIKAGIKPGDLEATWTKVHKGIRADPSIKKTTKKAPAKKKDWTKRPLTLAQRKDRVRQKMAAKARKSEQ
jgi:large subunit ribosomal protein L5e